MSGQWKDLGTHNDPLTCVSTLFGLFGEEHSIQNKKTGECKTVFVPRGGTLGDAIKEGGSRLSDN